MKVEVEKLELSTIVASLGKSRHYFECVRNDQDTADSLQQIRLKLMKQGNLQRRLEDFKPNVRNNREVKSEYDNAMTKVADARTSNMALVAEFDIAFVTTNKPKISYLLLLSNP